MTTEQARELFDIITYLYTLSRGASKSIREVCLIALDEIYVYMNAEELEIVPNSELTKNVLLALMQYVALKCSDDPSMNKTKEQTEFITFTILSWDCGTVLSW